jgi:hypothetical protein
LPDPWKCGVGIEDSSLVVESREDMRLWEEGVERPDLLGAPAHPAAKDHVKFWAKLKYIHIRYIC